MKMPSPNRNARRGQSFLEFVLILLMMVSVAFVFFSEGRRIIAEQWVEVQQIVGPACPNCRN